MPRTARATPGGYCYHVLNRGNARRTVFHKEGDYAAFVKLLRQAGERTPIRLIGYCLMPNHFHLVVWPVGDRDLSVYMQWLMTAHVRRYHRHYHSTGHVWQGRFKVFPIQEDLHLLTVLRYVERNAVRGGLVEWVEDWRYSSAAPRLITDPELDAGPVPRSAEKGKMSCPFAEIPSRGRTHTAARVSINRVRRPARRSRNVPNCPGMSH